MRGDSFVMSGQSGTGLLDTPDKASLSFIARLGDDMRRLQTFLSAKDCPAMRITPGHLKKWVPALIPLLLGGCSSIQSVPDMMANSQWQGRPVTEVINQFGWPHHLDSDVKKQWVVLVYPQATSNTSRQAMGTQLSRDPGGGPLVYTEYWGDVTTHSNCDLRIAINRARQVAHVSTVGGYCNTVDARPKTRTQ